ncbi:MAG: DUF4296 domain-containing protein [Winogradskyella sp.]
MKTKATLLLLCFLIMGCNRHQPKKPDHLISKATMEALLYDLYVLNAAKNVNKKLLETNGLLTDAYILEKYNIDSLQFAENNRYYAYNTTEYLDIIDNIKAKLEKEKANFTKLQKADAAIKKREKDAIKALKTDKTEIDLKNLSL